MSLSWPFSLQLIGHHSILNFGRDLVVWFSTFFFIRLSLYYYEIECVVLWETVGACFRPAMAQVPPEGVGLDLLSHHAGKCRLRWSSEFPLAAALCETRKPIVSVKKRGFVLFVLQLTTLGKGSFAGGHQCFDDMKAEGKSSSISSFKPSLCWSCRLNFRSAKETAYCVRALSFRMPWFW